MKRVGVTKGVGKLLAVNGLICCWLGATALVAQDSENQPSKNESANVKFSSAQIEFFESKIRPILVARCFECHGESVDEVEGGLSLASRGGVLAGGDSGPAVELDSVSESILIDAINYGDLFEMPPDSKLPQDEIDLLTKWIEMGAPWPDEAEAAVSAKNVFDLQARKAEHWCWTPIASPTPPATERSDWASTDIDRFILAALEKQGLEPADTADRRVLIRRAYFDLIGLPPTPEQVDRFVNDTEDNAFEKVIDELLASPHYGERWARHWMDLIRYAETYGHEFDYPIDDAFQFRDYLIRAFNADIPFDDFIREHIAGDLIEHPRTHPDKQFNESILGTGFWFLGEATHSPVDVKADEAGHIDNQIDVLCKTFLGITVACARCHDHKFDAISAEDYYALSGFLQSSRRQDVMLDPGEKIKQQFGIISELVAKCDRASVSSIEKFKKSDQADIAKHLSAATKAIAANPAWLKVDTLQIEGEALVVLSRDAGNVSVQELQPQGDVNWSENKQLWWYEGKEGDEFIVEFQLPYEATFEIFGNFTTAIDYGIAKLWLDDAVLVEKLDLYTPTIGKINDRPLGKLNLAAGKHQLKVKSVGTHPDAAPKFMFGLDYLKFVPAQVDQAEGDEAVLLRQIADEFDIDAQALQHWINAMADPDVAFPNHPLHAARQIAVELSKPGSTFEQAKTLTLDFLNGSFDAAQNSRTNAKLFADFSESNYQTWFETGYAFGGMATSSNCADTLGDSMALPGGIAHSGRLGKRMYGVLRSPTFEIEHTNIHYRMNADNARVRLIIDGYTLDVHNSLLFNGMTFQFSSNGKFAWRTQGDDLRNYIGHRAHIEIIDHGDSFVAVDEIWFSDGATPSDYPSSAAIRALEQPTNSLAEFSLALIAHCIKDQDDIPRNNQGHDGHGAGELDTIELFNWMSKYELTETAVGELNEQTNDTINQIATQQKSIPRPMIAIGMTEGSPENEFVFIRGNHNNLGPVAKREIITALRTESSMFDDTMGSGRLYLADQIADASNPLTSRVIVNRLWHHLTGRGIVPSVDNFGVLGETPSHPELLDFMAREFTSNGWSIKRMLKRIMMSKSYQISSAVNVENEKLDPNNVYLHRARVRRLQGEAIRDSMLQISGDLNPEMYGPGIAIHLTPFMQGRGRPGKSGPLNGLGRRSIYTEVRRNFLPPMMLAFDTPIPFNSIGRRTESNVPAQALILMNNPFVVEQSKKWAERLIDECSETESRIDHIYQQAFSRPPTDAEIRFARSFLNMQAADANISETDANDNLQVWSDLCHVIFNVKEFIFLR